MNIPHIVPIIIASLLPAILYLSIFKFITPYKSWNLGRAFSYMFFGICSPLFFLLMFEYFPSLSTIYLLSTFIQIALLEEIAKYIGFITYNKIYTRVKKDTHPLSIMFYSGATSLGFAFIENIKYGLTFGLENIYWRSVTAVLMHLAFGMMIGYWISLSKFKFSLKLNPTDNISGVSVFELFMKKYPKIRTVLYTIFGIFTATFFHGLYDMNFLGVYEFTRSQSEINSTWTIQLIIMIFSFLIVKKMADHLIKLNNKKIK
jgi:uncharacterized protein YneF (UPF0154 family)